jgi:regulation of enolase protein 1 (concanavalin A-like superfamily)
MTKRVLQLGLALVCAANLLVRAEAEELLRDSKLPANARWLRENPKTWQVTNGMLRLRIEPGNMWGPANDGKNVLLVPLPDDPAERVTISAIVSNTPTAQWEQIDLVWFYTEGNMVKLGHEMVDGKVCIVMGREEGDRARTVAIIPTPLRRVELRLSAHAGKIRGEFRAPKAAQWQMAGECDLPVKGAPHLSIQSYNGERDVEHWAIVENLRVETSAGQ